MKQLKRYKSLDKEILMAREEFKQAKKELEKVRASSVSKSNPAAPRVKPTYPRISAEIVRRPASQPKHQPKPSSISKEELLYVIESLKENLNEERNITIDRDSGGNVFEIPNLDKPNSIQINNRLFPKPPMKPEVLSNHETFSRQGCASETIPQPIMHQTVREVAQDIQDFNINKQPSKLNAKHRYSR